MSDQILWFATRGAGIVSLLLATTVACLGLLAAARARASWWPTFLTVGLHKNLALLSVVFLAVHIVTAIVDPFTSLGVAAALVPLASSYRPIPVALGVISVDLLVAVIVTSLVRDRIGHAAWRAVHWLAYAAWPMAILHSLTAGSDAFAPWMLGIEGACILAVGLALAWRLTSARPTPTRLREVVGGPTGVGVAGRSRR